MKLLPSIERRSKPQNLVGFLVGEGLRCSCFFFLIQFAIFQPTLQSLKNQNETILEPLSRKNATAVSKSIVEFREEMESLNLRMAQLNKFFQERFRL